MRKNEKEEPRCPELSHECVPLFYSTAKKYYLQYKKPERQAPGIIFLNFNDQARPEDTKSALAAAYSPNQVYIYTSRT